MGWFTSSHSDEKKTIDSVIRSLRYDNELLFEYDGTLKNPNKGVQTPAYILPVEFIDEKLYGFFCVDGKPVEARIGFKYTPYFFSTYYRHAAHQGLVLEKKENDVVYLPLSRKHFVAEIGKEDSATKKFIPYKGSPFVILGVQGTAREYPLMLAFVDAFGPFFNSIYYSSGALATFKHYQHTQISDHEIVEKLSALRTGQEFISKEELTDEDLLDAHEEITLSAPLPVSVKKEEKAPLEIIVKDSIDWKDPKSIIKYLDTYVVGQSEAKKVLAVAFSNFELMRNAHIEGPDDKDNVLLIGPSGVGKTYMARLLAKKASVVFAEAKVTAKSSSGYVGPNLVKILYDQIRSKTEDPAPYGVFFLDEIDKLAKDSTGTPHFFGMRLQDELIGWLEEDTLYADHDGARAKTTLPPLNTKNMLFIAAGAFQDCGGLADIVMQRLNKQKQTRFGFAAQTKEVEEDTTTLLAKLQPEDLIEYGLKPELIGRFSAFGMLQQLTKDQLVRILENPHSTPLRKYARFLAMKGYTIEMDPKAYEVIAEQCPPETGARALKPLCITLFKHIQLEPEKYASKDNKINLTPALTEKLLLA